MTIGALDTDCSPTSSLEEWLKSDEARELQRNLEEKILKLLFSYHPTDVQFQRMVAQLAWIGADAKDKPLLEKEIIALNNSPDSVIVPCEFFNELWKTTCKVGRFVVDHKTEILVGVGLCATGVGIAIVSGYSVSVVAAGVVVAGAGSIFTSDDPPNMHIPQVPPPSSATEIALFQQPISSPLPKLELPSSITELLVTAEGVWVNGQFFSNTYLMQNSIIAEELEKYRLINSPVTNTPALNPPEPIASLPNIPPSTETPLPSLPRSTDLAESPFPNPVYSGVDNYNKIKEVISRKYTIEGTKTPSAHIGWINGINNSFEESKNSGAYIQSLTNGFTISGIYNCSHTPVIDLLEAGLLNHNGFSPITANLLKSEWQAFHEANADRPNAKFLQICHSQGAIDVRNALEGSPQEIRDRVIVLAIAPGAIVPERLCFMSYNYASEKDIVYKLEPPPPRPITMLTIDDVILPTFGIAISDRAELILLQPHPGAKGIDHEFISPTYRPELERILANYNIHEGEYSPDEKVDLR